jgi:uncharacterized cofD-like protein
MSETSPEGSQQIIVIGGGTGNFTVLSGLKEEVVGDGLTAIVGMADDGGSTGRLRDEYGVLPPGDVRQCLVALSNSPEDTRKLFSHRFSSGKSSSPGLEGQNVGNIILTALEQTTGNFSEAIAAAGRILDIKGRVLPATSEDRRLVITTTDGQVIRGEHEAEESIIKDLRGARVDFDQPTNINPEAEAAIKSADLVVIAPGDIYTSIAPALAVRGMREALKASDGAAIHIANLMNRDHHTVGFTVSDHAAEVERIAGVEFLDVVLYNTDKPTEEVLRRYAVTEGELPVEVDETALKGAHYRAMGRRLLSRNLVQLDPSDALATSRSLIRHDPKRLANAIMALYYEYQLGD